MKAVRKIVDAGLLSTIIDLPWKAKDMRVEVVAELVYILTKVYGVGRERGYAIFTFDKQLNKRLKI